MRKIFFILASCSVLTVSACKKQEPVEASHETCYPMERRLKLAETINNVSDKQRFLTACKFSDPPVFTPSPSENLH